MFDHPVELTRTLTFADSLRRRRIVLIVMFLLAALLGSLVSINAGSPLNIVLGVLIGLAVAGLVAWLTHLSDRSALGTATLVLEPAGMRYSDAGGVRSLRWQAMEHLGKLPTPESERGTRGGGLGWMLISALQAADAAPKWAVIGGGQLQLAQGASGSAADKVNRLSRLFPRRLKGVTPVPIYLEDFERDWLGGQIGAWVEHYRPDLVQAAAQRGR